MANDIPQALLKLDDWLVLQGFIILLRGIIDWEVEVEPPSTNKGAYDIAKNVVREQCSQSYVPREYPS